VRHGPPWGLRIRIGAARRSGPVAVFLAQTDMVLVVGALLTTAATPPLLAVLAADRPAL